jgi:hypothetical protein
MHVNQQLLRSPLGDARDAIRLAVFARRVAAGATSSGGAPTGAAGGDLAGTYPNPTVAKVSAAFALTGNIKPILSGNVNDWNPTGLAAASTILADGGAADRTITGLAGPSSGRVIIIQNVGTSHSLILTNLDALSTGVNQFDLGGNVSLEPGQGIILQCGTTGPWNAVQHQDPYGTALNTICQGNDVRLSDARTPTGAAGGDLAGAYPNPTVKASVGLTGTPTAPTAGALTNNTQIATTAYADAAVAAAVTGTLKFKGATDCSANPNYPAALKGDVYVVSVAGKIGGASGVAVDVGDEYFAIADNAGGTQASVGASWSILEHNLQGALLAANNLSDVANAATAVNNLGGAASTGTGGLVRTTSPALVTPALGTPASGVLTNCTGTAAGLTAGNVTTNANSTGDVTSVGNATTLKTITSFAVADPALGDELLEYNAGVAANRKTPVNYLLAQALGVPGGRLTLSTGVWQNTTDVTSSTIFYTPGQSSGGAGHNRIAIYDGTRWRLYTFAEVSLAVPATQWRLFDVFIYDNAGTLTLETANWNQLTGAVTAATNASPIQITSNAHGLVNDDTVFLSGCVGNTGGNLGAWNVQKIDANNFTLSASIGNGVWTSGGTWWQLNGARATALAVQDGVLVKSGATTRRYLGTGMTNGTSGQSEDKRQSNLLYNAYNRESRVLNVQGGGHNYAINYTRYNAADPTLHVRYVLGLTQEFLIALFGQLNGNGVSGRAQSKAAHDGSLTNQDNIVAIPAQAVNCSTMTFGTGGWTPGCHFEALHENSPDAVTVGIGISGIRINIMG